MAITRDEVAEALLDQKISKMLEEAVEATRAAMRESLERLAQQL